MNANFIDLINRFLFLVPNQGASAFMNIQLQRLEARGHKPILTKR
jgi:hypothetical protein